MEYSIPTIKVVAVATRNVVCGSYGTENNESFTNGDTSSWVIGEDD